MSEIIPSVGRKVWFYHDNSQSSPIDGTIVFVHGAEGAAAPNTLCNIFCVDGNGTMFTMGSVSVGDETTEGRHFRWMPYQREQAAREQERDQGITYNQAAFDAAVKTAVGQALEGRDKVKEEPAVTTKSDPFTAVDSDAQTAAQEEATDRAGSDDEGAGDADQKTDAGAASDTKDGDPAPKPSRRRR